jgi:alpha-tubulin suppressor-like RCC1 family protein
MCVIISPLIYDELIVITENGDLFGWGNSEYGQLLCDSNVTQLHTSRHIQIPGVGKIVDAVAGGSFCAALNCKLNCFLFSYFNKVQFRCNKYIDKYRKIK